jgi:hypothetical protein
MHVQQHGIVASTFSRRRTLIFTCAFFSSLFIPVTSFQQG